MLVSLGKNLALIPMKSWFDNKLTTLDKKNNNLDQVDWARVIPYILLHLSCLFVISVGFSWTALIVCIASYLIRMFAITAFYHRYFSHKSFKTNRFVQFLFGFIGTAATQRGPLWWAAHHRHHHKHSDQEDDRHSPNKGFWKSHMLWFLNKKNFPTNYERVKDLTKFKELLWLDRFDILPPIIYAFLMLMLGYLLQAYSPEEGVTAWQILIWGYFISTVLLGHVTYSINSVAHCWGTKRFNTGDDSRNNFLLALLTLGEGWHNNHHKFPASAKQGIYWWELDFSYYALWSMKQLGLVWDIKKHDPALVKKELSS